MVHQDAQVGGIVLDDEQVFVRQFQDGNMLFAALLSIDGIRRDGEVK